MNNKLLTEQRLWFLSLKGGCAGPSESTLVKMPHCHGSNNSSTPQISFQCLSFFVGGARSSVVGINI